MPHQPEKRDSERLSVSGSTRCTFVSPVLEDFGPLRVKNISTQGIGLIASEPLEVGLMLVVKLVNPTKKFTKTLLVRVVHVTPEGGSYLVGGTIDAPLSYEELCTLVM